MIVKVENRTDVVWDGFRMTDDRVDSLLPSSLLIRASRLSHVRCKTTAPRRRGGRPDRGRWLGV